MVIKEKWFMEMLQFYGMRDAWFSPISP